MIEGRDVCATLKQYNKVFFSDTLDITYAPILQQTLAR